MLMAFEEPSDLDRMSLMPAAPAVAAWAVAAPTARTAVTAAEATRSAGSPGATAASCSWWWHLELQSGAACAIGQGLHLAVEAEPAAVEDRRRDALGGRPLGQQLANGPRPLNRRRRRRAQRRLFGGGGGQGPAGDVVDELGVDVAVAAEHGQPWPHRRARHLLADSGVAADPGCVGILAHVCFLTFAVLTSMPFQPSCGCARPRSGHPSACRD